MKHRDLLWLLLLLALPSCQHQTRPAPGAPPSDYIAIRHQPTRIVNRRIPPLVITIQSHGVLPACDEGGGINSLTDKPMTAAQRQIMQHWNCNIVRTDSTTYHAVVEFVRQNPSYFTADQQYTKYLTYSIMVNGQEQGVYLLSNQFFRLLIAHIQAHKGDTVLVESLRRKIGES